MVGASRTVAVGNGELRSAGRKVVARGLVRVRALHLAVLFLLLPLFGQSFHYLKALPPLWALSKAFPVISLPLALVLFRGERPVVSRQVLLSFLWLLLLPSFAAMFTFQQDFFTGLTAQVKLLPLLYFFSFLGLLRWMKPTSSELTVGFMTCAATTFVLLVLLWLPAPESWYSGTYKIGDAPLFSADSRGHRIRMPMYFGMIGLFYCFRRLSGHLGSMSRAMWLALYAAGSAAVVGIVRTRSMVVGLAGVAVINLWRQTRLKGRFVMIVLLGVLLPLLFTVPYLNKMFATDESSGFDLRWGTVTDALDFLGTNPLHWIFGVGTLSPLDPAGLITWFNHFFFLADITWLGVVFEYGLIGALLVLLIPVRGLMLSLMLPQNLLLDSLRDYLLYALLISPLYPLTLSPGEVAIILAIFVFALEQRRKRPLLPIGETYA